MIAEQDGRDDDRYNAKRQECRPCHRRADRPGRDLRRNHQDCGRRRHSDHVLFKQWFAAGDAPIAETGQIDGAIGAGDDQFGKPIADARPLLEAVTRKAIAEIEILQIRMGAL